MARQPEAKFKEKVMADLKTLPYSKWRSINQRSFRGTPDILGCLGGFYVEIELKSSEGAKIDPLQWHELELTAQAGGLAFLCYPENWRASFNVLMELGKRQKAEIEVSQDFILKKSSNILKPNQH